MNKIQEILDGLKNASEIFDYTLQPDECTLLIDYITILENDNIRLHNTIEEIIERGKK